MKQFLSIWNVRHVRSEKHEVFFRDARFSAASFVSLLLCLFILIGLTPVTALADSGRVLPPQMPDDSWMESLDPAKHISVWEDDSRLKTSGIFTYRILHRTEKAAAIVSVNEAVEHLTIPAVLDGYKIVCISIPWGADTYDRPEMPGKLKNSLKSLTIQDGVQEIGDCAFADCKKLTTLKLPKDLVRIGESAFNGCTSLKKVTIRDSKYITGTSIDEYAFAESVIDQFCFEGYTLLNDNIFLGSRIKEVIFPKITGVQEHRMNIDRAQVGKIWVDPYAQLLTFYSLGWDYKRGIVQKMVVNGKKTKIRGWNEANILGALYTVPKAECIKWAKKYKLTYKVKSCGKMGKVTYKKKKATWKKVKTTVRTYQYKDFQRKWKSSSRSTRTYYQVYGKKKKSGTYKLLKTTAKNSYKTKYKYLKVKPVTVWS